MEEGVDYTGVDIAGGPVAMTNPRASQLGLAVPQAELDDALDLSRLEDNVFDVVVSIGALHHTGDFRQAISEVVRVTKPGGLVIGMVYSVFSMRNWIKTPSLMLRTLTSNIRSCGTTVHADEQLRWLSDHNSSGSAAPATEYFSRRALRAILSQYGKASMRTHNFDSLSLSGIDGSRVRHALIKTPFAKLAGLDIYFTLRKALTELPCHFALCAIRLSN
jgi:ubiquinone/menaquinone biosynthesis C-methylase UbiE